MTRDLPGLQLAKWLGGALIGFALSTWRYLLYSTYYDSPLIFLEEEAVFVGGVFLLTFLGIHLVFRPFENFLSRLDKLNFYLQRIQRLGRELQQADTESRLVNQITEQIKSELPYERASLLAYDSATDEYTLISGVDTDWQPETLPGLKEIIKTGDCVYRPKFSGTGDEEPAVLLPVARKEAPDLLLCLFPRDFPRSKEFHRSLAQRYREQLELAFRQLNLLERERAIQEELNEKIEAATREIKEQQQFLETIISNLDSGLVVCNSEDQVQLVNERTAAILELDPPGGLPTDFKEFKQFLPIDIREARSTGGTGTVEFEEKHLEYTWQKIEETGDQILLLRDRTAKINMEKKLELNRSLSLLGEMAASVAHELRNPLGAMELYLGLLERQAESEALRKPLDKLKGGMQKLKRTIRGLLNFTKTGKPDFQSLELTQLLENVLNYCRERLERKEVEVHKELNELGEIQADREQLRTLFVNLIQNGIEAQNQRRKIDIIGEPDQKNVKINVRDYGEGIPPEEQEEIFDLFYSSKSSGTGLGLTICQRIAEVHSGEITVQSTPGEGTTFQVKLPREPGFPGGD